MEADLSDPVCLYLTGEYVSENELRVFRFLNTLPEEEIEALARTFTEGYRIGFIRAGKPLWKKKTVCIRFPLGFERIVTILRDLGWTAPSAAAGKTAFLVNEKIGADKLCKVFELATALRANGQTVTVQPLKKNAKFQVETLEKNGYTRIRKIYADTELTGDL